MLCASRSWSTFPPPSPTDRDAATAPDKFHTGLCYFSSHDMNSLYMTSMLSDRRDKTHNACSAPRFLLGAGLCCQWDRAAPSGDKERSTGAAGNWEALSKRNHFTAWWQNQVIMSSVKGFAFVREKYPVITIIEMANFYKTSVKIN